MDNKADRAKRINYMLDRITGRAPVPSQYQAQLETLKAQFTQPATPSEQTERPRREERPPRERNEQREQRPPRNERPREEGSPRPENNRNRDNREQRPTRPERPQQEERPKREFRGERPERLERQDDAPQVRGERPQRERTEQPRNERPERNQSPNRGERPERRDDRREERKPRPELRSPNRDDRKQRGEPQLKIPSDGGREAFEIELKFIDPQGSDLKPMPRMARPPRQPRPTLTPEEAQARLAELRQDITIINGIGPKVAQTLVPLGITNVERLIYYLPRRYDDYTRLLTINHLKPDVVTTVIGKVVNPHIRIGQNGRRDFAITLDDGTGRMTILWFNGHYLQRVLKEGMQIVVSGKVTIFRNTFQMANPEWEALDSENLHTIGIVPVYRLSEGIKARSFRRTMKQAVETWAERVPDYVPQATLDRAELADLGWTIKNLHFPEGFDHLEHAQRRRVFDELLLMQLAILGNRRDWQKVPSIPLLVDDGFLDTFLAQAFPYEMTGAQNRTIADIRRDVASDIPMNRLVQGDVGAGKTAVAITAMAMAVHNGKQAAIMAPTSILAEQHYRAVSRAFANYPAEQKPVIGLLTGALSNGEREAIYRGLADGSIDVIVGTHALIQEGVEFKALAVAVVDEQHRFGVQQRARLRGKGTHPHLLVMTATPIPRTLALTMYADLDLSIIDEKPKGRLPIETYIELPYERQRVYEFVESQLAAGRQAFVIHPLVEASEVNTETRSAVEAFEELKHVFFRSKVCLLHGRMSPREKDDIMGAFARHEYDVMVTTSVAEVGVDIPNASVILIEGANRFGLAQLHQFRGRVGRGEHQSYCLLMVEPDIFQPEDLTENASRDREWTVVQQRLLVMEDTDDGFKLAEMDWKLRGAGDLLGARQSGSSQLQLTEMMMPDLVALAQREARTIYESDPALADQQHHLLKQMIEQLQADDGDVS
jgi:ATP-dependent DNA helicase RecG